MTRQEHLDWCKQRALDELEYNGLSGAYASMISDLGKWDEPLYKPQIMSVFIQMGQLALLKGPLDMKHWIEGFN